MTNLQLPKKEKGTKIAPLDSVKNQVQYTKYNKAIQIESNSCVKPLILNRNVIQNLLSNSINSLEDNITSENNRIGNILKNEKKNIENLLIKNSLK